MLTSALCCRSFRLAWGTNAPLYAADVVLAATALLEAPPATRAGETSARDDRSDCIWCASLYLSTCAGHPAAEEQQA